MTIYNKCGGDKNRKGSVFIPRHCREKADYSTYHVIQRGNGKIDIFLTNDDRCQFLRMLDKAKDKYGFLLYGYCLMSNHVHLIVYDNGADISEIMKSVNVSYVSYFNNKYQRSGHLFQDRFKSQMVTQDRYLLALSRYVHNNPVKAGLVDHSGHYNWSSYNIYAGISNDPGKNKLVDKEFILSFFSDDIEDAAAEYIKFMSQVEENEAAFLDTDDDKEQNKSGAKPDIVTVDQGKQLLYAVASSNKSSVDAYLKNRINRNTIVKELRAKSTLSLREIAQVCGNISESTVSRILSK